MFTGDGDPSLTRNIGLWNNQTYATTRCYVYNSVTTTKQTACNPWAEQIPITGTDGLQFSPNLDKNSVLSVFNADIMRTLNYTYNSTSHDFKGYTTLIFETDSSAFENSTANAIFNVNISGTANLTSITGSPAFAAKGNYLNISP